MNKIIFIADLFAIPFFYLLYYYFNKKNNKTNIEIILYLFSVIGLVMDTIFTIYFILFNL